MSDFGYFRMLCGVNPAAEIECSTQESHEKTVRALDALVVCATAAKEKLQDEWAALNDGKAALNALQVS